jgi:exonuclease V gamma subunit
MAWCMAEVRAGARAQEAWEGGDFQSGEREDAYFAYAWRDADPFGPDFEALAERILRPLIAHRSEDPAG